METLLLLYKEQRTSNVHTDTEARLIVENSVKDAIANGEFYLEYQPQLYVPDYFLRGISVRASWDAPAGSSLNPNLFVPLLEAAHSVQEGTLWMLRAACTDYMRVHDSYDVPPLLTVELSKHMLNDMQSVQRIEECIAHTGIDAAHVELLVSVPDEQAVPVLEALRKTGIRIMLHVRTIDEQLHSLLPVLPLDAIKLNHLLTADIAARRESVKHIVEQCHRHSIQVLAEAVTQNQQYALLLECGCDAMQGDMLCRPTSIVAL